MLQRLLSALLFFGIATSAAARCTGENLIEALPAEERAALDARVAEAPYPEGNLWRAEKPGSTVHVLGTVHIPDPRLDGVADRVRPIVAGADLLVLEATTAQQADIQRIMAERPEIAFLTEGPTLIDLLGDETWAEIAQELETRGVPPFLAAKFRPWLLAMTLAVPQCALDTMVAGELGLDARLEHIANDAGTPIETLDDLDAILGLLNEGTVEEQLDMLRLSLLLDQDQAAAMATTLDSYFAGRHRELWEFSRILAAQSGVEGPVFEAFEESLLDDRNTAWADRLPDLIGVNDAVVAVGAAHLSGETGVLRALERMGYSLTRL